MLKLEMHNGIILTPVTDVKHIPFEEATKDIQFYNSMILMESSEEKKKNMFKKIFDTIIKWLKGIVSKIKMKLKPIADSILKKKKNILQWNDPSGRALGLLHKNLSQSRIPDVVAKSIPIINGYLEQGLSRLKGKKEIKLPYATTDTSYFQTLLYKDIFGTKVLDRYQIMNHVFGDKEIAQIDRLNKKQMIDNIVRISDDLVLLEKLSDSVRKNIKEAEIILNSEKMVWYGFGMNENHDVVRSTNQFLVLCDCIMKVINLIIHVTTEALSNMRSIFTIMEQKEQAETFGKLDKWIFNNNATVKSEHHAYKNFKR